MAVTDPGVVTFELESCAIDGERLEVSGRWHGVRGRRFVRPTLSAQVGRGTVRALADLEHKPWAPDDGESWVAAFDWTAPMNGIDAFELAVAPDLAVSVPAPGTDGRRTSPGTELPASRPDDGGPQRPPRLPAIEDGELRQRRSRERAATELKAALAARNEALGQLDNVSQEWARAVAERDGAVAERNRAAQARNDATTERDQAVAERDQAVAEWRRIAAERERAAEVIARLTHERDRAVSGAASAAQERDRALSEAKRSLTETKRIAEVRDDAVRRLAHRPVVAPRARVVQPFGIGERWRVRAGQTRLATRLLALAALLAFIVILLLILTST
jgi:hypothetical protein